MDALLPVIALMQCLATLAHPATCKAIEFHDTLKECRQLAREYAKFDKRGLAVIGAPAMVSYICVTVPQN